jgi:effector-binding domain-containing protein
MGYDIRIEQVAECPLAVVRRRASHDQFSTVIPEACGTVWNLVKAQQIPGAGRHIAVYLDQVFNLEIGVELAAPAAVSGELVASSTPGGTMATTTHFGPYQGLGAAHQAIQGWCKANGYDSVGPCWETYGHWQDAWNNDPSKIRTDIYYLLSGEP